MKSVYKDRKKEIKKVCQEVVDNVGEAELEEWDFGIDDVGILESFQEGHTGDLPIYLERAGINIDSISEVLAVDKILPNMIDEKLKKAED